MASLYSNILAVLLSKICVLISSSILSITLGLMGNVKDTIKIVMLELQIHEYIFSRYYYDRINRLK